MSQSDLNRWIAYRKPNPRAQLRMFCFHYAGGGAAVFRGWQADLPGEIEVCPIQLPGRESRLREPSFQRLDPILQELPAVLQPLMDLPYVFFGHSMGAIISFELSLRLRRMGWRLPLQLLLSGRRAPHRKDTDPPLHDLPDEEFKRELRQLEGTPQEVLEHPELMELLTPLLRADFAVCETYEHDTQEPPLDLPVSVFGGLTDHKVGKEDLEAWRQYTRGTFKLRMFAGNHFFLNGPSRPDLIRAIAQDVMPLIDQPVGFTG